MSADRPAKLLAGLLLCLLAVSCGSSDDADPAAGTSLRPDDYAAALTAATNAARSRDDLPRFTRSRCLAAAARRRAARLVGEDLVHHDLRGVEARCAPGTRVAENLARSDVAPDAVVAQWRKSPGHLNNLLDPALITVGTGCVPDEGRILCSQLYAPAAAR